MSGKIVKNILLILLLSGITYSFSFAQCDKDYESKLKNGEDVIFELTYSQAENCLKSLGEKESYKGDTYIVTPKHVHVIRSYTYPEGGTKMITLTVVKDAALAQKVRKKSEELDFNFVDGF